MSLVSEALRKARQEAAAREAARQGRIAPAGLVTPPARRSLSPRPLLLVALVAAAGLAGALGAWLAVGTSARPAATRPPAAAGPAEVAPGVPTIPPAAAAAGASGPPPAGATRPVVAPPGTPEEATFTGASPRNLSSGTAPPPLPSAPPPAAAPTLAGGDRVFVLDADLGRVRLHLDYVVFKPSAPFAGINGAQVVPGSIVEGLVVEEIGRDFVRLRDGEGTVTLKVR
ncbi:MAG TPA: hypothetical protein P5234_04220 [Thermoanaerobaculaceae bacterium]|nr:hypothetical protein [Thermoanaerobaculaceae bacterium]HRS15438.1 hypothetical protein [Thermoanaerobaculaceae bacterium]